MLAKQLIFGFLVIGAAGYADAPASAQGFSQDGPTAQAAAHSDTAGIVTYDKNSDAYFYHGATFHLGTLTLGDLKAYCANQTVLARSWRMPTSGELNPVLGFLAHGKGVWSDFARIELNGPGYLLPTATPQAGPGFVNVYELYGNTVNPQLSFLGLRAAYVGGPTADSAPLTDGSGNHELVKVVCISDASNQDVGGSGTFTIAPQDDSKRVYIPPGLRPSFSGDGFTMHVVYKSGYSCVVNDPNHRCIAAPMLYVYAHNETGGTIQVTYKFIPNE